MKKLRDFVFSFLTKIEKLDYFLVIVLWSLGALAAPFGFPWIVLGILCLHAFETVTIGLKVGKEAGEKFLYSLCMCMTFGFTWWVPLRWKTENDLLDK